MSEEKKIVYLKLDKIWPNPYQTRGTMDHDHIRALADDILANGLLQIPTARPAHKVGELLVDEMGNNDVELAFGHNRLNAYYLLQADHPEFDRMPLIIKDMTDEEMALTAWSENEARKQLNPVERANAVKRFMETFQWTHQQIAEKLHVERSTITNMLRILRLPDLALKRLNDGDLTTRQAMALIPFFELTNAEQLKLLEYPEFAEFLSLAGQGQINSDVMREKIGDAIAIIHPAPPQFNFTAPAETPTPPEPEQPVETPSDQAWLQKDIEGNDVSPEPVPPVVEAPVLKAAPAPVIPANQPALPTAPVASQVASTGSANDMPAAAPVTEMPAAPAAPKTWAESQYTITLGFMPEDGNEMGRQIFISTRRNEGTPKFTPVREKALNWNMPWQLDKLIKDLHPEDFEVEA